MTPGRKKQSSTSSDMAKLKSDIVKTSKEVKGQMGLYMKHMESGRTISVNQDKIYPLAGVFKLAVMVETFRQADAGMISLDERIELETRHYCIGEGLLQYLQPGLKPTVRDLLSLMIISTDNTASEMLWKRIGIQRVNMLIRELGLAKTSIYIPYRESYLMSMGYGPYKNLSIPDAARKWKSLSDIERMKALNETEREAANLPIEEFRSKYEGLYGVRAQKRLKTQRIYDEAFDNFGTPREIGVLLEKIVDHDIVSPDACEMMLSLLMRQNSSASMSCLLSPDIKFALKSGDTACSLANAGVIYVSTDSHVVLCCFFKDLQEGDKEKAVLAQARIARSVYEYFSSVRSR
ncbi:MAG: serine hydrolase [Methanobacteriota archaeon]|nr:MAG: serine hydrolase [Euryarchaeota archaeon]